MEPTSLLGLINSYRPSPPPTQEPDFNVSHLFKSTSPTDGMLNYIMKFDSRRAASSFTSKLHQTDGNAAFETLYISDPKEAVYVSARLSNAPPNTDFMKGFKQHGMGMLCDSSGITWRYDQGIETEYSVGMPVRPSTGFIDSHPVAMFIMQDDGELVGKACLLFKSGEAGIFCPNITSIEVSQMRRKEGHGTRLLEDITQCLSAHGFEEIAAPMIGGLGVRKLMQGHGFVEMTRNSDRFWYASIAGLRLS